MLLHLAKSSLKYMFFSGVSGTRTPKVAMLAKFYTRLVQPPPKPRPKLLPPARSFRERRVENSSQCLGCEAKGRKSIKGGHRTKDLQFPFFSFHFGRNPLCEDALLLRTVDCLVSAGDAMNLSKMRAKARLRRSWVL